VQQLQFVPPPIVNIQTDTYTQMQWRNFYEELGLEAATKTVRLQAFHVDDNM